jgi:hypothetical protein
MQPGPDLPIDLRQWRSRTLFKARRPAKASGCGKGRAGQPAAARGSRAGPMKPTANAGLFLGRFAFCPTNRYLQAIAVAELRNE